VIDIETDRTTALNEFERVDRPSTAWLWQAATGVLLLLLLTLHMIANHFVVEGGLRNHAQVVAYLRTPVIFFLEHLFLVTVTIHAVLGVRAVLFDFGLAPATERRVTGWLTVLGIATVAYGVWLLWAVAF
jgi:succinate dehydrogenase / fumarate reductase cytochrome b subunit